MSVPVDCVSQESFADSYKAGLLGATFGDDLLYGQAHDGHYVYSVYIAVVHVGSHTMWGSKI